MNTGFTLIRKKADTYRSQGLHGEALELYAKFIVRSATIDPATKYFIKKQVQLIEMEMNGGDSGVTQELSADRTENLKEKVRLNDTEDPKRLLNQDSPSRKCFHRNYDAKSFIKSIVVFVLVGSIFFYFVDWFSEVKKNDGGEVVQKTLKVVLKKMPTFVSNEPTSTLPDNGMEGQSAMLPQEKAVIGDSQSVDDSVETQEAVDHFSPPTNYDIATTKTLGDDMQKGGIDHSGTRAAGTKDTTIAPGDPDPASVIDYVLKKRGRQL